MFGGLGQMTSENVIKGYLIPWHPFNCFSGLSCYQGQNQWGPLQRRLNYVIHHHSTSVSFSWEKVRNVLAPIEAVLLTN